MGSEAQVCQCNFETCLREHRDSSIACRLDGVTAMQTLVMTCLHRTKTCMQVMIAVLAAVKCGILSEACICHRSLTHLASTQSPCASTQSSASVRRPSACTYTHINYQQSSLRHLYCLERVGNSGVSSTYSSVSFANSASWRFSAAVLGLILSTASARPVLIR
jgi:hypothetical protein